MNAQTLLTLFTLDHRVLHLNVDGIGEDEAYLSPEGGGNSMNWVAGHIVASRDGAFGLLGLDPPWGDGERGAYARGSANVSGPETGIALVRIVRAYDESQQRLAAHLRAIDAAALERPNTLELPGDPKTIGEALAFFNFHETYHVGQLGLLRRLVGKAGAIA